MICKNMEIIRYKLEPNSINGLQITSQVMIDKIMQIEKLRVQKIVGHITKKQINDIESRLLAILGVN
jgi:mRNA-degrading endonuclease toxin of MazEF toxin-antitoxin module